MLTALMGGKALTATELAMVADITSQTASSHLAKLVDGQLLVVRKQGRHKYFQLKGYDIAELLESLLNMTSTIKRAEVATGPDNFRLRKARVCYDHLAGELAVELYDSLNKRAYIIDNGDNTVLTNLGKTFFAEVGVDFNIMKKSKRPVCKSCLDWSERRNHLAGVLGQWILSEVLSKGWASKDLDSRAIHFTENGLKLFKNKYINCDSI
jgi:predicted transcriptional regulator